MNAGITRLFLIGSVTITALLFLVLRPIYAARMDGDPTGSLLAGLGTGLLVIAGSFFVQRWAFRASTSSFFVVFLGGMLVRLILFGALIGFAYLVPVLHGQGVAVALLTAFFPLTLLEVLCLVRWADGVARNEAPAGSEGASSGNE